MKNRWPSSLTALSTNTPDWAILIGFFAMISLQAIPSLLHKSPTFDEVMRQLPGFLSLTAGYHGFHIDHPPLVKLITALPLLLLDIRLPPIPDEWTPLARWGFAHEFLFTSNDADQLVFLGRIFLFPFLLLLGFFVYRWSKEIFGRGAAIVALALYSFSPNVLAHGRLMNSDFAVTCFSFLTIYGVHKLLSEISLTRLLLTGLSLGLAMITKFSALWILPVILLLAAGALRRGHIIGLRLPTGHAWKSAQPGCKLVLVVGSFFFIGVMSYAVIWDGYGFRYPASPVNDRLTQAEWTDNLPDEPGVYKAVLWAKKNRVLPEAYLLGLSRILKGFNRRAFLMGEISDEGWRHYFLVTFAIKTPLALLLAMLSVPFALGPLWKRRPVTALCLALPALTYFFIASASRLNIGHRHLLPIYPFLFVLAGALVPWAKAQNRGVKAALGALGIWYIVSSVSVFPHYLAYFNELAGGPDNGYRYLVDSNLDWGQDLKGLKRYMDEHGIARVWLSYFGTASPEYYGIAYNALPSYTLFTSHSGRAPTPYVAISATNLQGIYLPASGFSTDFFAEFRERKALAKIGYSIFLYKVAEEETAKWL